MHIASQGWRYFIWKGYMESGIRSTETKSNILQRGARTWSFVIIAIGLFILAGEAYAYPATEPGFKVSYLWYENLIPLTFIASVLGLIIAWEFLRVYIRILLAGSHSALKNLRRPIPH